MHNSFNVLLGGCAMEWSMVTICAMRGAMLDVGATHGGAWDGRQGVLPSVHTAASSGRGAWGCCGHTPQICPADVPPVEWCGLWKLTVVGTWVPACEVWLMRTDGCLRQ